MWCHGSIPNGVYQKITNHMALPLNSKGSNQIQKIQIQFKRFKLNSKDSNSIQKIQIQLKRFKFNSKESN